MAVLKPHISINVNNLDASIDFYKRMFRTEPARIRHGYAKFDLESPSLNFAMNLNPGEAKGNLSHLGIEVDSTSEVNAWKARWLEDGLSTRDEENTTCCYAVQDKAWVKDPDGNEWEVFAVLDSDISEEQQAAADETKGSVCCGPAEDGAATTCAR